MKKHLYSYLLPFTLITLASLSGCYYDNEDDLYGKIPPINDTTVISYAATIQPMIANNCATSGCHVGGAQSPNLSTYQGVFTSRGNIRSRAVEGNPSWMPAAGPMSEANRNALGKWIDDGALNN
jgi:hypothetical protein